MKRILFMNLWLAVIILASAFLGASSIKGDCDADISGETCLSVSPVSSYGATAQNQAPIDAVLSGRISHTTYTRGQTGKVTFNRFPATVEEFEQVREKIGGEPHGAVALQIMAFEMYRRDRTLGETCIRLNSTLNNVNPATSRLRELFGNDAGYARPYQMAAFLKGATPQNGYKPTKPYIIEVKVSDVRTYQNSNDYQTQVLCLNVLTNGKLSGSEIVEVLNTLKQDEPSEGKYFIVFNAPGLYSQVQAVSFANPFQGLE